VKKTILVAVIVLVFSVVASAGSLDVRLQRRGKSGPEVSRAKWDTAKTAIIVCDMWNEHWCKGATARVAEMARPMNRTILAARKRGVFIIHAPSSCLDSYANHPARKRAQSAPKASDTPPWIGRWASKLDSEKNAVWPIDQSDGGCDCEPKCRTRRAWTRQIAAIKIADSDAITDSGVETWGLLKARGIDNVIVLGVHTNMCVIGRPFGLRNLTRAGKNVVLARDLTDTMYNSRSKPYVSHFKGTQLIVDYIETYVCPTITSSDITGAAPFAFKIPAGPVIIPPANVAALRRAITDLTQTFGSRYPKGTEYLKRLDSIKGRKAFDALKREALLANPLLDFDKLLVVKRRPNRKGQPGNPDLARGWDIGFPRSSFGKSSLKRNALEGEIAVLSPVTPEGKLTTLYKPKTPLFVGDVDLHFSAERMLFTRRDERGNFQIHEISAKGGPPRQVSKGDQIDVHNHDACYLPNGDIVFASTACFQGVPCNRSKVALLYRMNPKGQSVRQLCFDQDHNFHPSIQEDGRVMYLRWEYSDLPHTFSRIMFQMNPDGTGQMALYGGSSYWPNGIYSARAIPGKPTMFAGVVAGHHDCYRTGELVLFDVAKGRRETEGVVQRIPGYGKKVQPLIEDKLTSKTWPKFAHPWPLSDPSTGLGAGKYFLTTCKLNARSPWDIYLVDVFDNMLRLHHEDGWGLFEPIPFRKTRRPTVIPDKVDLKRTDATVLLADIYRGKGLTGVPRGAIKRLRLVTLHYCYQGLGGQYERVGLDGPWDVKQVLGTVPVESDGSANFRIPANMPISVQPLDAEGKAVQLMRSWLVGMPGEVVSCVGCHETGNMSSAVKQTIALRREPSEIKPFYGPRRGFSFNREIQPVLDKYCLACHNGKARTDGKKIPDLRLTKESKYRAGHFTPSYMALRRLVRTPTMEPDMHMLATGDFHADTTELVQMLRDGHHNVKLSAEAWERLITWIDIQTPAHGTWRAIAGDNRVMKQAARRRTLLKLYTGRDEDPEPAAEKLAIRIKPILPEPEDDTPPKKATCEGWPFSANQAAAKQKALGATRTTVDLGKGLKLKLVRIPAGRFATGSRRVTVAKPFWMGQFEVTNRQYAAFDPSHDSRMEPGDALHFESIARGFALNKPDQPVARVSWIRAIEFCKWLSKKSGKKVSLPTGAQWEWACRAGTDTPMWFGKLDTDFAANANLADATFKHIINYGGYDKAANIVPPWRPAADKIDDNFRVSSPVGKFAPNPWGLHDMHGNVAEWTLDASKLHGAERRIARGGSWYDRPKRATSTFRGNYKPWLGVYNVGFRIVIGE